MTDGIELAAFNGLPESEAVRALRGCCASRRWAERVAAGRPYATAEQLYAAADAVLAALDEADVDEALAAHPRIGDRPTGADSRREQAGVATASEDTRTALADVNRAYEARFGHVYLVCATGKSAEELLAIARARLTNDPATERAVLREELAKINGVRLRRLLDTTDQDRPSGGSYMSTVSTHVLDSARGRPAADVGVRLESADGVAIASGRTDADGRIGDLDPDALAGGSYRLVFDTAGYFAATGQIGFYPEVVITFTIADPDEHYHVPLLLAPYAYSTYRGS